MNDICRRNRPLNRRHQAIVEMACRPQGVTNKCMRDQFSITAEAAASALNIAEKAGRTHAVIHPDDPGHKRRWFICRVTSRAWLAGPAPEQAPAKISAPAPQDHAWRPVVERITAGSSRRAPPLSSSEAIAAFNADKIQHGVSPVFGIAAKFYVDPATVRGPFGLIGIGRDIYTRKPWGK